MMAKLLSFLLLFMGQVLAVDKKVDNLMQQVSVWIEHRYATTEIALHLKNTDSENTTVSLAYDLKRSDYIHDLRAVIGGKNYTGQVMERDEADEMCQKAEEDNKACVKVETGVGTGNLNTYRAFNFVIKIPANQELKVFLRYSAIIFLQYDIEDPDQEEKITYDLRPSKFLRTENLRKPKRDIFQVFIKEISNIVGLTINCIDEADRTQKTPITLDTTGYAAEPYEYYGIFESSKGNGLCKKKCTGRSCGRGRRSSSSGSSHITYRPKIIQMKYDVKRKTTPKLVKGRLRYVEDINGHILIQNDHFIHIIHDKDIQRPNKRIIFILDKSGSMITEVPGCSGNGCTRMEFTKRALEIVLDQLVDGDEFNIISFSSENDYEAFHSQIQEVSHTTITAAKTWLRRQVPTYETYLAKPVQAAVDMCLNQRGHLVNTIIILTDGAFYDTGGADQIIKDTRAKIDKRKAQLQVNTISLGDKTYTDQMGKISFAFEGTHMDIIGTKMPDIEKLMFQFYNKTSIPLFHNVQARYSHAKPGNLLYETTVFDGKELMVLGKVENACASGKEPVPKSFPVGNNVINAPTVVYECNDNQTKKFDFQDYRDNQLDYNPDEERSAETSLEHMFNYYKISKDLRRLNGDPGNHKLQQGIIDAALKYNFVTDLTSMYLENSDEFQDSITFGGFSNSVGLGAGAKSRYDSNCEPVVSAIHSIEFCANLIFFVGTVEGHYDGVVSVEFDLSDHLDDAELKSYFEEIIGNNGGVYYFSDVMVTFNNGKYDQTRIPSSCTKATTTSCQTDAICDSARTRPGPVILYKCAK